MLPLRLTISLIAEVLRRPRQHVAVPHLLGEGSDRPPALADLALQPVLQEAPREQLELHRLQELWPPPAVGLDDLSDALGQVVRRHLVDQQILPVASSPSQVAHADLSSTLPRIIDSGVCQ